MYIEKREHLVLVGMQIGAATMEINVVFPQKSVLLLDMYPKDCMLPLRYLLSYVLCCSVHNSQEMETA